MQDPGLAATVMRLGEIAPQLRRKPLRHWLTAVAILFGCYFAAPAVDAQLGLRAIEYRASQMLLDIAIPAKPADAVKIVLVGDDNYWLGSPAGRAPLNRAYLATLLKPLERTRAAVVAIDFDLRSLDPRSPRVPQVYRAEKRRADVVGIFPNGASIVRLIGAVLMEANDEWSL